MNSHIPVSQPTRRVSDAQRKSSRQLDGFASTHKTPPLQALTRPELVNLRERTHSMLSNSTIMATLPDKGSKLKEKLALIDSILNSSNETPDAVTEEVSKLSLESNNRPNIRKKSVADANLEACRINLSSNLLQAHNTTHNMDSSNDMETDKNDTTISGSKTNDDRQQAKVRMISLDESVRLQNTQRDRIKEEGFKKQLQSLKLNNSALHGDDISASMSQMQLGGGGQSDEDGGDNDEDDDDDDDDDDSDYNYDSAYDEDEGSMPEDGLEQDDYYDGHYQQR